MSAESRWIHRRARAFASTDFGCCCVARATCALLAAKRTTLPSSLPSGMMGATRLSSTRPRASRTHARRVDACLCVCARSAPALLMHEPAPAHRARPRASRTHARRVDACLCVCARDNGEGATSAPPPPTTLCLLIMLLSPPASWATRCAAPAAGTTLYLWAARAAWLRWAWAPTSSATT